MRLKKIYLPIILGAIILNSANLFAQHATQIKDVDELKQEDKVIIESYPNVFKGAEINKVERLNSKHAKVYYSVDGNEFEAVVNADRKDLLLVATCKVIKNDALPQLVKDVFTKEVKAKIEKAYEVTTPYSSEIYRIDYVEKDGTLKSIFYNELGAVQKAPY